MSGLLAWRPSGVAVVALEGVVVLAVGLDCSWPCEALLVDIGARLAIVGVAALVVEGTSSGEEEQVALRLSHLVVVGLAAVVVVASASGRGEGLALWPDAANVLVSRATPTSSQVDRRPSLRSGVILQVCFDCLQLAG